MRRIPVFLLVATALAGISFANPVCTGTLQNAVTNYTSLATACQVGDKLFYNFTYSGTSGTANPGAAPSASQVNLANDASNPNEPGLIFSSSFWTVSGTPSPTDTNFIDSNITFSVATFGLVPIMVDASLDFTGQFAVSGVGQAFIGETVTPAGGAGLGLTVDSSAGSSDVVNFAVPVATATVIKDLQVKIPRSTTGGPASTAAITSFREGFSEFSAPEPIGFLLIGSGLLGIGILRRRRS